MCTLQNYTWTFLVHILLASAINHSLQSLPKCSVWWRNRYSVPGATSMHRNRDITTWLSYGHTSWNLSLWPLWWCRSQMLWYIHSPWKHVLINPRHTCEARVTVLCVCMCLSLCLSVSLSVCLSVSLSSVCLPVTEGELKADMTFKTLKFLMCLCHCYGYLLAITLSCNHLAPV